MPAAIETIDFHGQPALRLATASGAQAVVLLLGAQVVSWTPPGGPERLYLSERAAFDGSAAVRGGVPVCFPQFAARGPLPRHGFVRTMPWSVETQRTGTDFALATLRCTDTEATRALWPHRFALELTVAIEESRLDLELEVVNEDDAPFSFTAALHTYLKVREVEETRIEGLYGLDYEDSTDAGRLHHDSGDVLLIESETDRIYREVARPLLVREYDRSLGINQEGFHDVVVWNPWEERCAALADMPDRGFRHMLCVEAAAVHAPIELEAGLNWWGRQTLVAL
ncbi:D-hexose-6-phosphate mutarotase [Thauera sinica]|uniref:Putative glucose-6-phosphate 1-epimerase n=1 Tax=Thauera sinica TaxID=2665146 RepID=A0ABW1AKR4_9RHOO|nr:D-hexose-6-phosphate mutarotase [Thauera sp. K11]ATE59846.1 D-hexose-6-phosphate mutarotase [Thauera sp. K11]